MGAVGETPAAPVRPTWRNALPTGVCPPGTVGQSLRRLFERANARVLERRVGRLRDAVFHSTYYTWLRSPMPQVATVYDLNHELFPEMFHGVYGAWIREHFRDYVRHATRVIAISQQTKADLVRLHGIDPSRISVVHLAVNRKAFWPDANGDAMQSPLRPERGSTRYVLYVGARGHYKNFRRLVEAFAGLPKDSHLHLVCAGGPWNREEEKHLRETGAAPRVRLVVHPSLPALRKLYSRSAAFVCPSLGEGFGLPLLEAMACGTMVLASDIPVFREVAGDAAVYFDPLDVDRIRKAIERCLDPVARREHVRRGEDQLGEYSWEKCAEQTHAVHEMALHDCR
jgi:glycosyltransferase involved in cell wall biosynthesis